MPEVSVKQKTFHFKIRTETRTERELGLFLLLSILRHRKKKQTGLRMGFWLDGIGQKHRHRPLKSTRAPAFSLLVAVYTVDAKPFLSVTGI